MKGRRESRGSKQRKTGKKHASKQLSRVKAESRGMIRRGPAVSGLSLPIAPALLQPLRVSLGVTSPPVAGPSLRQDGTQLGGETLPGL